MHMQFFRRLQSGKIVDELRIFIALLIFIGIYSFPAVRDYWKKDFELPIMKNMSLN